MAGRQFKHLRAPCARDSHIGKQAVSRRSWASRRAKSSWDSSFHPRRPWRLLAGLPVCLRFCVRLFHRLPRQQIAGAQASLSFLGLTMLRVEMTFSIMGPGQCPLRKIRVTRASLSQGDSFSIPNRCRSPNSPGSAAQLWGSWSWDILLPHPRGP